MSNIAINDETFVKFQKICVMKIKKARDAGL